MDAERNSSRSQALTFFICVLPSASTCEPRYYPFEVRRVRFPRYLVTEGKTVSAWQVKRVARQMQGVSVFLRVGHGEERRIPSARMCTHHLGLLLDALLCRRSAELRVRYLTARAARDFPGGGIRQPTTESLPSQQDPPKLVAFSSILLYSSATHEAPFIPRFSSPPTLRAPGVRNHIPSRGRRRYLHVRP
jgi:hypothetical protein